MNNSGRLCNRNFIARFCPEFNLTKHEYSTRHMHTQQFSSGWMSLECCSYLSLIHIWKCSRCSFFYFWKNIFLFSFFVLVVRCFLSTIFNDLCSPLEFRICFTQWKFFEIFSKISHDHRPPALHVLICLNVSQTCIRRIYISNSTQFGRKSLHLTLSRTHARLDGCFFLWVIQFSSFFSCWKIYWIISSLLSRSFFPLFSQHTRTLFLCATAQEIFQYCNFSSLHIERISDLCRHRLVSFFTTRCFPLFFLQFGRIKTSKNRSSLHSDTFSEFSFARVENTFSRLERLAINEAAKEDDQKIWIISNANALLTTPMNNKTTRHQRREWTYFFLWENSQDSHIKWCESKLHCCSFFYSIVRY